MNALAATVLRTRDDAIVPLQRVSARGRLEGLLFELTVEQHYRNTAPVAIEPVFTFPLPLNAVLLAFELDLNGTLHKATAFPRAQAETRYERAIDTGDTAALLTDNGNGLYTVSLGNLQAGDTAVIRYRYAELLGAHDDYVRLAIPTVIAPRYGDPARANLEGPAIPGSDLLVEYPFEIRIDLVGLHDAAAVRSPSHALRVAPEEAGLAVHLARAGFLDRDLILELRHSVLPNAALHAPDGDGTVVLASTALTRQDATHRALTVKLLLDCSGSMQGDRIESAKRALRAILGRLDASDRMSLSRFGSTVEHLSEGLEPADAATIEPLKLLVRRLEADLGGTEMARALASTLALTAPSAGPVDLVLITDGEVHDLEGVLGAVARARHRLFVIAIGAAPNEALARRLADTTGGACEFVAPGEDVEGAILRTFDRLRAMPLALSAIDWSAAPAWTSTHSPAVFAGDTLHRYAGFAAPPTGPITLTVADPEGSRTSVTLPLAARTVAGDLLPRLAAAARLRDLGEAEATELAVRYQLVSPHTSFVLVAERESKAGQLPATIAVAQMMPADFSGVSMPCAMVALDDAEWVLPADGASLSTARVFEPGIFDAPFSCDRPGPDELDALLASLAQALRAGKRLPTTLAELCAAHPVPPYFARGLHALLDTDGSRYESTVIRAFIAVLVDRLQDGADARLVIAEVESILRRASYRDLRRRIEREVLA